MVQSMPKIEAAKSEKSWTLGRILCLILVSTLKGSAELNAMTHAYNPSGRMDL